MPKFMNATNVITGVNTRWSYANVWDPKSINGGAPKYSVSLIIPKSDTATVNKIKSAIQAAYEEGQAVLHSLEEQYDNVISWADLYDTASLEAKKMIVNCLIRRVEVYRDYKLHIDFNIDFAQFSLGLDIAEIAA